MRSLPTEDDPNEPASEATSGPSRLVIKLSEGTEFTADEDDDDLKTPVSALPQDCCFADGRVQTGLPFP